MYCFSGSELWVLLCCLSKWNRTIQISARNVRFIQHPVFYFLSISLLPPYTVCKRFDIKMAWFGLRSNGKEGSISHDPESKILRDDRALKSKLQGERYQHFPVWNVHLLTSSLNRGYQACSEILVQNVASKLRWQLEAEHNRKNHTTCLL